MNNEYIVTGRGDHWLGEGATSGSVGVAEHTNLFPYTVEISYPY